MAFTQATLTAQLDSTGTGKTVRIERYLPDRTDTTPLKVDVYVVPINGYRGKSGWYSLTYSNTAAQAAAELLAQLL